MTELVKNRSLPYIATATNLAAFLAVLGVGSDLLSSDPARLLRLLVPAGAGVLVGLVLNGLIGVNTKSRLVTWRWRHFMPGCRAFTHYGPSDPRVDMERLEVKLGTLPRAPREQDKLWINLYYSIRDTSPGVQDALRFQLASRDYTALSALFLIFLGPVAVYELRANDASLYYLAVLVAQYLLARHAALRYWGRLISGVLAEVAAKPLVAPQPSRERG